jgi:hypothetical protein
MKVKIDCDRRVRERGSKEMVGGWYYDVNGERYASYAAVKDAAIKAGHEIDNAGWKHKMLMWNWHSHSIEGYSGWEIEKREYDMPVPAFVKLTHRHSKDGGDVESSTLCNEWDDIAEADFYQRDWTDDGIPFVREGETYWSGWWFATIAERDRFVKWYEARENDLSKGNRG